MPPVARVSDASNIPACTHGCPGCPHTAIGPGVQGSPNVLVNNLPCLRVGDPGAHGPCCQANAWNVKDGSATVFVNGLACHRQGDQNKHCGGIGVMAGGSSNVIAG